MTPYTTLSFLVLLSYWSTLATGCPTACPLIYAPVCGPGRITYSNQCQLQNAFCGNPGLVGIPYVTGACTSITCPDACPMIYDPVCGPDQVTYGNSCELQNAFCDSPGITGVPGECAPGGSGDPHMLVYINGVDEPVCFDYYGNNEDVIRLIQDDDLGLTVNAELFTKANSAKTFFKTVGISAELCSLKANFDDVLVNGRSLPWQPSPDWMKCGSETSVLIESEHNLEVKTLSGVQVSVERAVKVTRRNVTFEHVNVFFQNQHQLSSNAKGLIGQFTNMQGKLVRSEGADSGVLVFPEAQRGHPISVQLRHKRRPHSKQQFNCWFLEDAAALIGSFKDYKVL